MNYTLLIYETPSAFEVRANPEKQQAYWEAWPVYSKALKDAGVFVSGAGLQPPDTATTVKTHDNRRLVQDGPYADTKEQLGGFYIIDVPDLDTALEWASRCPAAAGGVMEVRPNLPDGIRLWTHGGQWNRRRSIRTAVWLPFSPRAPMT